MQLDILQNINGQEVKVPSYYNTDSLIGFLRIGLEKETKAYSTNMKAIAKYTDYEYNIQKKQNDIIKIRYQIRLIK